MFIFSLKMFMGLWSLIKETALKLHVVELKNSNEDFMEFN